MHLDRWTLLLQTVNFTVLIWLLHRFLYRPVQQLSDARRTKIQQQFAEARQLAEQAKSQLRDLEGQRAGIAAERKAALTAAGAQAQKLAAEQEVQARQEAQATLAQARETLAAEREQAERASRGVALQLAAQVALRLLLELPPELRQEAWLERITQYLSALPPQELQALRAQLTAGTALEVRTAESLPPSVQQRWQEQLQSRLDVHTRVSFAVDPGLMAGAELRFPRARVEFSWQSVLKGVRERLQVDEALETHAHAL
ncbi:MAG TPA: hypothetical protein VMF64_10750 [Steroidobacteraceae bacterium]|nr:hypothetical protein [Steroidobacteraceae bacterium]